MKFAVVCYEFGDCFVWRATKDSPGRGRMSCVADDWGVTRSMATPVSLQMGRWLVRDLLRRGYRSTALVPLGD